MYLSKIRVSNYKGIRDLEVSFSSDINVIVGENGCGKTTLIDAIRLLYSLGEQQKTIYVNPEDFYRGSDAIQISYEFRGLSLQQKGTFYQYLVLGDQEAQDYAKICLRYRLDKERVVFNYFTGEIEGQKADHETFRLFVHYYLGALRDSTRDLLSNRSNILGRLLQRLVTRNQTQSSYESVMQNANSQLLTLPEVKKAESSINANLVEIFRKSVQNQIGLQVAEAKVDTILNIIRPYLPHDRTSLQGEGFSLRQNSLGFNNLIYAATILGDINERQQDDPISHSCLLIEEPEAHLHPQLQQSLFAFLRDTNAKENSQLFVTTHSPTLTSRVPLSNLIVMSLRGPAINIDKCFDGLDPVTIIVDDEDSYADRPQDRKRQLERYLDVTRSQLFFGKGVLFVEGISEELLIPAFARVLGFRLEDYKIELVNVHGTSFYPFLSLFNAADELKRLSVPVSIVTDDDRFTDSKDSAYSFKQLLPNRALTIDLHSRIEAGSITSRISNIQAFASTSQERICLKRAFKTFEYDLIWENVGGSRAELESNPLISFLFNYPPIQKKMKRVRSIVEGMRGERFAKEDRSQLAILIWKALPPKAQFAQDLSSHLFDKQKEDVAGFTVPKYIKEALDHLTSAISS